jgi:hypothetical protein
MSIGSILTLMLSFQTLVNRNKCLELGRPSTRPRYPVVKLSFCPSSDDVTIYFTNDTGTLIPIARWFPTCGTLTLEGTRRTGWGYAKIILIMADNTKKK